MNEPNRYAEPSVLDLTGVNARYTSDDQEDPEDNEAEDHQDIMYRENLR